MGIAINCYNKGNIKGQYYVGGIIGGYGQYENVINCFNFGNVNGLFAGGIDGYAYGDVIIKNCYNIGTITNMNLNNIDGKTPARDVILGTYRTLDWLTWNEKLFYSSGMYNNSEYRNALSAIPDSSAQVETEDGKTLKGIDAIIYIFNNNIPEEAAGYTLKPWYIGADGYPTF